VRTVRELDQARGTGGNYAFYLSLPPKLFPTVVTQLKRSGLAEPPKEGPQGSRPWRRVVIEKPFGHDLASAQALNAVVDEVFPASAVLRIDRCLRKETVQNSPALRFANPLSEPLWSRNYVAHVQIPKAEHVGVGARPGDYDSIGAGSAVHQN